jgi:hypothetical protein
MANYNEVDATNLESIKSARKKVASPRFGGASSALMTGPKKSRKKVRKRTVVK